MTCHVVPGGHEFLYHVHPSLVHTVEVVERGANDHARDDHATDDDGMSGRHLANGVDGAERVK